APDRPRAGDRPAGRHRPEQPDDRREPLPVGADGRQPPRPHLRQARRVEPHRAVGGPQPGRGGLVTPEQIELVRASDASLRVGHEGGAAAMARDFYRNLFAADPAAEALFSTETEVMATKFSDELGAIVEAIVSYETFATRLHDLADRHVEYGVETRHYR